MCGRGLSPDSFSSKKYRLQRLLPTCTTIPHPRLLYIAAGSQTPMYTVGKTGNAVFPLLKAWYSLGLKLGETTGFEREALVQLKRNLALFMSAKKPSQYEYQASTTTKLPSCHLFIAAIQSCAFPYLSLMDVQQTNNNKRYLLHIEIQLRHIHVNVKNKFGKTRPNILLFRKVKTWLFCSCNRVIRVGGCPPLDGTSRFFSSWVRTFLLFVGKYRVPVFTKGKLYTFY